MSKLKSIYSCLYFVTMMPYTFRIPEISSNMNQCVGPEQNVHNITPGNSWRQLNKGKLFYVSLIYIKIEIKDYLSPAEAETRTDFGNSTICHF